VPASLEPAFRITNGTKEFYVWFDSITQSSDGVEFLLANTTFLNKISHSSKKLRIDNIRGSFNGSDIIRTFDGIQNSPRNFDQLFGIHMEFTWEENIERLVYQTNAIVPMGIRFEPSEQEKQNILEASRNSSRR